MIVYSTKVPEWQSVFACTYAHALAKPVWSLTFPQGFDITILVNTFCFKPVVAIARGKTSPVLTSNEILAWCSVDRMCLAAAVMIFRECPFSCSSNADVSDVIELDERLVECRYDVCKRTRKRIQEARVTNCWSRHYGQCSFHIAVMSCHCWIFLLPWATELHVHHGHMTINHSNENHLKQVLRIQHLSPQSFFIKRTIWNFSFWLLRSLTLWTKFSPLISCTNENLFLDSQKQKWRQQLHNHNKKVTQTLYDSGILSRSRHACTTYSWGSSTGAE